ncbi:septum site-determining protein MinD [Halorubrum xinjiangense]|uniref:Septum site-determining protein MinD n=1 Tax=Halorubrum xinjiangense TaxID=261291 RepID=A0A1G7RN97_9EURY|nr:P-loop NTPase [Halorubrum xinjiangense]SDG12227.1 septum site-determining protein MinD [Halorubrum xinjiangense]
MATVYAVASAKGGVGKTTTTAALATVLADSGADVVAIDADLGMANLAGAVGVTPGETTLHDVLAGEADPAAAVREGPAGLRVVPGATDLDAYAAADPSGLGGVVEAFDDADFVFVDAGAGLSHDSTLPLAVADETLLVSTPERSALGDTEKTRQLTERLGGTVAGAAITRVTGDTDEVVTALLDAPILGRIPDDEAVARAAAADRPLLSVAPDAPATRAYRDLARALTGGDVDGAGLDAPAAAAAAGVSTADSSAAETDDDAEEAESDDETESEPDAPDDDAVIVDEEPSDDDDGAADSPDDGDEAEADERGDAVDEGEEEETGEDEDIIVADPDATGVTEPGDGDDIIVASESEPPDAETAGAGDEEPESAEGDGETDGSAGDAAATETTATAVDEADTDDGAEEGGDTDTAAGAEDGSEGEADDGDETVDGDETAAEAADSDAIPDADETARESAVDRGDEDGGEGRASDEPTADDIDDELAGSIPFRDDDTGTMNTVLSEGDDETGADGDDESAESGTGEESAADDEEPGDDGGFFSRLLGR